MNITIRKFKETDAIKAGNVVKRVQRTLFKKYYPQHLIDAFCRRNDPKNFIKRSKERQYFVAEDKNKILGVIAIEKNQLRTFYVDPKYHGKGIGRKLFERFKKEAIKKGYKKVKVGSSLYAEPIYKSLGFKKVKKVKKKIEDFEFEDTLMEQNIR